MQLHQSSLAARVALGLLLLLAGGCSSVLKPKVDETRFFVLGAPPPPMASEVKPYAGSVGLVALRLPGYLADRKEFANREGAEVVYLPQFRWAEGRERAFTDRLRLALADRLRGAEVHRTPWPERFSPGVLVSLDLERFEQDADGTVQLQVRWALLDGESRSVRSNGRFDVQQAGSPGDPDDRVIRLGAMVDQLATELAARIVGS